MSQIDLAAVRRQAREAIERASRATKGPWRMKDDDEFEAGVACEVYTPAADVARSVEPSDADFIAAARTDVPTLAQAVLDLADKVERLRARMRELEAKPAIGEVRTRPVFPIDPEELP